MSKKNDEEVSEQDYMAGDLAEQNELIERIQYRLGVSKEEAQRIIKNSELI